MNEQLSELRKLATEGCREDGPLRLRVVLACTEVDLQATDSQLPEAHRGTCGRERSSCAMAGQPADEGHVTQGHLYDFNGRAVIALKSGSRVPVEYVERVTVFADAADLVPLAMRYHGGSIP